MREVPVNIVGSCKFGRDPKISVESTTNMFVSDGWLVNYPGYQPVITINPKGSGRGSYNSVRGSFLLVVIDNQVYNVSPSLSYNLVGTLTTYLGDIFIDENEKQEIAISDGANIYIYNYKNNTFLKANIDFIPNTICYQDGRFIAGEQGTPNWHMCSVQDSTVWTGTGTYIGVIQTKGDTVNAVIPVPGAGSLLYIMGNRITESWYDVGAQLFPYQKTTSYNIDYGCISSNSIAYLDNIVVWLSKNAQAGPAIVVVYPGTPPQQISTDGIDYLFDNIVRPDLCHGSMFRIDGHLFYQLTFPDSQDNLSITYDFNTKQFYFVTDQNLNYHPARRIVYFNNSYYFISFNDGNLYQFSSNINTLSGELAPRIRLTDHIRDDNSKPFMMRDIKVNMQQGNDETPGRIDTSISLDGGVTFGNTYSQTLNNLGYRQNIFQNYFNVWTNDFVAQYEFWGDSRFVIGNGVATIE